MINSFDLNFMWSRGYSGPCIDVQYNLTIDLSEYCQWIVVNDLWDSRVFRWVMMSSQRIHLMTNMPQILCYTYISQPVFCILCMKYVSKLIAGKPCLSVHNLHASSPSSLSRRQLNTVRGLKFAFNVVKFHARIFIVLCISWLVLHIFSGT